MGLVWSDIDFDHNTITIQRATQYLPDMGVFTAEMKTKSSHRVIKAPAAAIHALKQYRTWQRITFLQMGQPLEEGQRVFVTQNETPMHPDTLTSWFGSFIKTTDLPPIHIHSLRHPYVKRKTKKFANPFGARSERFSQHPVLSLGAA